MKKKRERVGQIETGQLEFSKHTSFLMEILPYEGAPEIGWPGRERIYRDHVKKALSQLPDLDQTIITLRFGLDGQGRRTLKQIAEAVKLTPQSVDYRLKKLLKK